MGRTLGELDPPATSREEDERRMPGRFGLTCFGWVRCGDGDLALDGDSALCSLEALEGVFLSCFGGGSLSEVTVALVFLSRNA